MRVCQAARPGVGEPSLDVGQDLLRGFHRAVDSPSRRRLSAVALAPLIGLRAIGMAGELLAVCCLTSLIRVTKE